MKKLTVVILTALVALVLVMRTGAKQERVCWHHEAQGNSDQSWTKWMPWSAVIGHQGHVGDYGDIDGSGCGEDSPVDPIVTEQPPVDPPIVDPPQQDPPASYTDTLWLPIIAAECVDNGFHVGICTNNH